MQNIYYLKNGKFYATKAELLQAADYEDLCVLQRSMDLSDGCTYDFDECFDLLFTWCQKTLTQL